MKTFLYQVPEAKKIRVIVDTDCACEGDDQFAVAHILMTPKFDVKAIVSEHFGSLFGSNSLEKSQQEVEKIVELMGLTGRIKTLRGCISPLSDEKTFIESEGSRYIVEEAMKEDPNPLFVVNQGAITNLASAYLMEPRIAERLTAIWIGGGVYPEGGMEFNLYNDIAAANVIMDSPIPLWQVPKDAYSRMKVSFSTLYKEVYPFGEIGKYLVEHLMQVNEWFTSMTEELENHETDREYSAINNIKKQYSASFATSFPGGESWQLGDSPVVGLMLTDHEGHYSVKGAPRFNADLTYLLRPNNTRKIRIYDYIDSHFILDDFYAKLQYHFS